jgi:hypothetical protein
VIKSFKKIRFVFIFSIAVFGFSLQCIVNSHTESKYVNTLINSKKIKGQYIYQWNQINQHGNQVSNNNYRAILMLGKTKHSTPFRISSDFPHVFVPIDSLGRIEFPFMPPISVNSPTYSKGDTVCIKFELDSTQNITLHIEKE